MSQQHSEEPASHCVTNELKVVNDPSHRHLTSESETVLSVPIYKDLNKLSANVAEPEQLSSTAEQEFLVDLIETLRGVIQKYAENDRHFYIV